MSNTYQRDKQKKAAKAIAGKSVSDMVVFRSMVIFIDLVKKYPKVDFALLKAYADIKAFFVTYLSKPIEWLKQRKMRRKLAKFQGKH